MFYVLVSVAFLAGIFFFLFWKMHSNCAAILLIGFPFFMFAMAVIAINFYLVKVLEMVFSDIFLWSLIPFLVGALLSGIVDLFKSTALFPGQ